MFTLLGTVKVAAETSCPVDARKASEGPDNMVGEPMGATERVPAMIARSYVRRYSQRLRGLRSYLYYYSDLASQHADKPCYKGSAHHQALIFPPH